MNFDQRTAAGLRKLRQFLNGKHKRGWREVARERLSRFVRGLSMESLERRDLLATDIVNLPTLDLTSTDQLVVELGGSSPGQMRHELREMIAALFDTGFCMYWAFQYCGSIACFFALSESKGH